MSSQRFVVVDASVSLKWALDDEVDVVQAIALRDDALRGEFRMVAPSLWLFEVTNGLVTATKRKRILAEQGAMLLSLLLRIGVRLTDPEADQILATAVRYGLSAYDASYLALADALGCPLYTGDRRFFQAASSSHSGIFRIGDYS